ncbi:filamentous hemagglutinin N-terminal domain-containing protein [Burkholderia dolosa]|uniref:filamentous hemagglutinin N-terminal domain-containing protein n=1 Tax=Burkholderia dolosa TaxID=152500 RepID=UPI00158FACC1|nr:filamentous hemagglutinin N-terminal domain-containing protein [Burkholderia dolosa]
MKHIAQPHRHAVKPDACRALVAAIACAMPLFAAQAAHAQAAPLVVDPSAANRPTLANAANGTPIVNITAPDGAGISHNRFTEYNVNPAGLVLNNSASGTNTQLAGHIDGNTLLGGSPASVILNQVTGANASVLAGATEVAGQNARVIVANPNGISVNGGSFINANRVSLVAGTTEFNDDGTIRKFRTDNGRLSIDGAGIDARNVDQLDLIARTLAVNAKLQAQKVAMVALRGSTNIEQIQRGNRSFSSQTHGAVPDVAIDVSKLGSMHANSIMMYGTSAGVGVNVAGKVDAVTGNISMSGGFVRVRDSGSISAGNTSIDGGLDNAGTVTARNSLSSMGVNNLATGRIESGGSLSSTASVQNAGVLHADGPITVMGSLVNERGGRISSYGKISQMGMGGVTNAGEIVEHMKRPQVTPPVVVAEKPAQPEVSTPVATKPAEPTPPVVVAEKPAQPEASTPVATKPAEPTPPAVVAEKPAQPEVSTPVATKPAEPTPPVVVAEKPAEPEVSTPVATKPAEPAPPVVVAEKPAQPDVSTPVATKPAEPTPPAVAAEKPAEPEVSTPVATKPAEPAPPVVVAEKPAEPEVSTPVATKPAEPAPPVVVAEKPARPPVAITPLPPMMVFPPIFVSGFVPVFVPPIAIAPIQPMPPFGFRPFRPYRPAGLPSFAFSPFDMMPSLEMFTPSGMGLSFASMF